MANSRICWPSLGQQRVDSSLQLWCRNRTHEQSEQRSIFPIETYCLGEAETVQPPQRRVIRPTTNFRAPIPPATGFVFVLPPLTHRPLCNPVSNSTVGADHPDRVLDPSSLDWGCSTIPSLSVETLRVGRRVGAGRVRFNHGTHGPEHLARPSCICFLKRP